MNNKLGLFVILLFLAVYVVPLGVRPLVIPDESRYGEIPREMVESGDWVTPRLNGLRYFEKPVLGYWLNATAIKAFGETGFSIRLPAALAAGLSALCLFLLVRRFTGSFEEGLLAAGVLLTSLQVYALGIYSVLDGPLSAFVTMAMVAFFFAYRAEQLGAKIRYLILFGVSCGLAFLTKGFLAFAVPVIVIVPFLIWEKKWKDLFLLPWIPIAAAVLVALPWALKIHEQEGDFWHYFFWIEHIKRFSSENPQHAQPFWYYIPVILAGALPWTLLLPATGIGLKKARFRGPMMRFALCWFLLPLIFFSISGGKIGTYILPCFAPLAIIVALGLTRYFEQGANKAFNAGAWVSAVIALIAVIALMTIQFTGIPGGRKPFMPEESWRWMLVALSFIIWMMSSILSAVSQDSREKLLLFALSPVLLMFSIHFSMPAFYEAKKAPGAFLEQFAERINPNMPIVTDNNLVHLVCWTYKRNDVYLLGRGELAYGLEYDDAKHRLLDTDSFNELVLETSPVAPVVLIAELRDMDKHWGEFLPVATFKASGPKFFYAEYRGPPPVPARHNID